MRSVLCSESPSPASACRRSPSLRACNDLAPTTSPRCPPIAMACQVMQCRAPFVGGISTPCKGRRGLVVKGAPPLAACPSTHTTCGSPSLQKTTAYPPPSAHCSRISQRGASATAPRRQRAAEPGGERGTGAVGGPRHCRSQAAAPGQWCGGQPGQGRGRAAAGTTWHPPRSQVCGPLSTQPRLQGPAWLPPPARRDPNPLPSPPLARRADPNRCDRGFVGNTIGQANAVSNKALDLRFCKFAGANLSGKTLSGEARGWHRLGA